MSLTFAFPYEFQLKTRAERAGRPARRPPPTCTDKGEGDSENARRILPEKRREVNAVEPNVYKYTVKLL